MGNALVSFIIKATVRAHVSLVCVVDQLYYTIQSCL